MEVAVTQGRGERGHTAEVRVIPLPFTRYRGVDRVMNVVIPLRGEPVAAAIARGDQPRIIQVTLGDQ